MADATWLVLSTFPDAETARRVARALVESRHAACANILPAIQSVYRWQERVEEAQETMVFFKTTRPDALQTQLQMAHPYEVPEIIAWPLTAGLPEYLRWVAENCS